MKKLLQILILILATKCGKMFCAEVLPVSYGIQINQHYHPQGLNYYLIDANSSGNLFHVYYQFVSQDFFSEKQMSIIKLQYFDGNDWKMSAPIKLFSFYNSSPPRIFDIHCIDNKVLLTGSFDSSQSNLGAGILVFENLEWKKFNHNFKQNEERNIIVKSVKNIDDELYIIGDFDSCSQILCNGIVKINGNNVIPIIKNGFTGFDNPLDYNNIELVATINNVFIYSKNKLNKDSFAVANKFFKKIALWNHNQFEQFSVPNGVINAVFDDGINIHCLTSNNLLYVNKLAVYENNIWTYQTITDSFYATGFIDNFNYQSNSYFFVKNTVSGLTELWKYDNSTVQKNQIWNINNAFGVVGTAKNNRFYMCNSSKYFNFQNTEIEYNHIYEISLENLNLVKGKIFNDENNNGIFDNNEFGIPNHHVLTESGDLFAISNSKGDFYVFNENYGNQNIYVKSKNGLECDSVYQIKSNKNQVFNCDFPMISKNINDVSVKIWSQTGIKAKQGFDVVYFVKFENKNNQQVTRNFEIILPKKIRIFQTDGNIISKHIIRHSIILTPNSEKTITFSCVYQVDTFSIGDTVKILAKIIESDDILQNNSDTLFQIVSAAYDPNIKIAFPSVIPDNNKEIIYNIYFQNLGNDTATNVIVVDTLSDLYSFASIEVFDNLEVLGKKPIFTTVYPNIMKWRFMNLNLPPKSVDSVKSIGLVSFRIKTLETFKEGDSVKNKAAIFFDYQKPVITNNATVIRKRDETSIEEINYFSNLAYPNPFNDFIQIKNSEKIKEIKCYNTLGQLVFYSNETVDIINTSEWTNGIYHLILNTENGLQIVTILKN